MINQIAKALNVAPEQIKSVREMAWVYCVVVYGRRATFVSKKAVQPPALAMPALVGSDKQVAWAKTIRKNTFDRLEAYCQQELGAKLPAAAPILAKLIGEVLQAQTKASWWIDGREFGDRLGAKNGKTTVTQYQSNHIDLDRVKRSVDSNAFREALQTAGLI